MPITIADDVFGSAPGGEDANQELLLAAADAAPARRALERAVERFRLVDGLGVEHDEDDETWQGREGLAGHSCKYASAVAEVDGALHVRLDCQDVLPARMGQAYVRILREELERAGVGDATVRVPDRHDDDDDGVVRTRQVVDPGPAAPDVPAWVVRFPGGDGLPVGFPPDIDLPAGASVVYAEASLWHASTMFAYRDGSWGAQVVLAVDDRDAAMAHLADTLPPRGYALAGRATQDREEGEAVGVAFTGNGMEVEVNGIGPEVARQVDPAFRAMPGKAAVLVVAFQSDPGSVR